MQRKLESNTTREMIPESRLHVVSADTHDKGMFRSLIHNCIRRILHHEDSFILDAGGFCVRRGHGECGEGDAIQAGNEQSNDRAAVEFHGDFSLTVMYLMCNSRL